MPTFFLNIPTAATRDSGDVQGRPDCEVIQLLPTHPPLIDRGAWVS